MACPSQGGGCWPTRNDHCGVTDGHMRAVLGTGAPAKEGAHPRTGTAIGLQAECHGLVKMKSLPEGREAPSPHQRMSMALKFRPSAPHSASRSASMNSCGRGCLGREEGPTGQWPFYSGEVFKAEVPFVCRYARSGAHWRIWMSVSTVIPPPQIMFTTEQKKDPPPSPFPPPPPLSPIYSFNIHPPLPRACM